MLISWILSNIYVYSQNAMFWKLVLFVTSHLKLTIQIRVSPCQKAGTEPLSKMSRIKADNGLGP
jgi:hypothetical protein